MIRGEVKVFDHFPEITEHVNSLARRAVQEAAIEGARVAAEIGAERGASEVHVVPVHGDVSGWTSGFKGKWYYTFQSFGTLGRRKPKAKSPGSKRTHAPDTGISPNKMYQRARAAGRKRLFAVIFRGH